MLSVTLLRTMESKTLSTFLLTMESVTSRLFDIRLATDICFFLAIREKSWTLGPRSKY